MWWSLYNIHKYQIIVLHQKQIQCFPSIILIKLKKLKHTREGNRCADSIISDLICIIFFFFYKLMNNNIHNNIQRFSNFLVVLKPANKPHHFQHVITNKWLHCDFPEPVRLWSQFHSWIYLLVQRRVTCRSGTVDVTPPFSSLGPRVNAGFFQCFNWFLSLEYNCFPIVY